jgi:predicted phosphodiesterase
MLNILLVGDIHISGKNPPARKDDLTITQWGKIEQLVELSNKHNAPIICTGDIFQQSIVSHSIMSKMGDILSKLNHSFFFVFGNHDLQYHNIDMIDRTSIGVMWLNNQRIKHISEFEQEYGIPWSYINWRNEFHDPEAQFLLAHRAIVNDHLMTSNSWILKDVDFCQHVKELTKYQLIVCGHWHRSYDYFYQYSKDSDTHVINPGVLLRRTIDEREEPKIFLLDLEDNHHYAIPIKINAELTDDVLRKEDQSQIIRKIQERTEDVEKLVQELIKTGENNEKISFLKNIMTIMLSLKDEKLLKELSDIISTIEQIKNKE